MPKAFGRQRGLNFSFNGFSHFHTKRTFFNRYSFFCGLKFSLSKTFVYLRKQLKNTTNFVLNYQQIVKK
jgi:hypothetical protein